MFFCCAQEQPADAQVVEAAQEEPVKQLPAETVPPPTTEEDPPAAQDPPKAEEPKEAPAPEPAPPPAKVEEPAPVPLSVEIQFDKGTVKATKKPLGCVFSVTTPLTVQTMRKGCHADELGIQPGWVLKAVGGEDLLKDTAADALNKVKRACEPLQNAPNSVELVFDANGKEQIVRALRSPLGLKLDDQNGTLAVTQVGGYGASLQVQMGWTLKTVGGQDINKLNKYDDKVKVLSDAIKSLPKIEKEN